MAQQPTLSKGEVVNDTYEIRVYIGCGAFGEVYRVQHKHLGTQVLKLLKEEYVAQSSVEEIIQEARVLTRLTHPNIVRVFEANSFTREGKERFFITMGFVSGECLSDMIHRCGPLPLRDALKLQRDMLEGLDEAHSATPPIVHRDINGDNILVAHEDEGHRALLSDFGLAKYVNDEFNLAESAGRMPYWAPECFWNNYFPTSDVFSAGVVFYRMLTGYFPWNYDFAGLMENYGDMRSMVLNARKQPFKKAGYFTDGIPPVMEKILATALTEDATQRYGSAGEFIAALEEFATNRTALQQTLSPVTPTGEFGETPLKKPEGGGFADIAGMEELKEILRNDVLGPLHDKESYKKYKISIPNGMLLHGPPGCGKTFIARKLAEEAQVSFIEVKPSDLGSQYIHGTQEKIKDLFREARREAPAIVFIDEIDAILPSRENSLEHSYASEVNELLAQMNDCNEHDIFVIGATNRPDKIDPAVLRTGRMDKVIYCPPPDLSARSGMFRQHLKDRPITSDIDYDALGEETESYVSSDIAFIVNEASKAGFAQRSDINMTHLRAAIRAASPSISLRQIAMYESFRDTRSFS